MTGPKFASVNVLTNIMSASMPCQIHIYYYFQSGQLSSLNGQSLYNIYPVKGSKAFTIYIFASCVVIKLAVQPTLFNRWSPNSTDTFICRYMSKCKHKSHSRAVCQYLCACIYICILCRNKAACEPDPLLCRWKKVPCMAWLASTPLLAPRTCSTPFNILISKI